MSVVRVGKSIASAVYFGDGSDGDAIVSAAVTLTRDMYYRNLTIVSGAVLNPAGYRIFVSAVLDLTTAPANGISVPPANGNAAIGSAGGSVPTSNFASGTTGFVLINNPGIGANGAAGNAGGPAGATGSSTTFYTGGQPGTAASGAAGGGSGASGGGLAGAALTAPGRPPFIVRTATLFSSVSGSNLAGGGPSPGAGSGAGDSTHAGGGGGSGAQGGAFIAIFANRILRASANSSTGIIASRGGIGGSGGIPVGGNTGGGGGACGAGGGSIYIVFNQLVGSSQANALDVSGGSGGNGGVGSGTGTAGQGGQAGFGGTTQVINLATGACTILDGRSIGGNANTGATGGASTPVQTSL